MAEPEEGMDFLSAFTGKFGSLEGAQQRLKAERRAGLTPKQRERRGPPKQQINFRATAETKALIDALAEHLGKSATDVMALAVEELAKATKIGTKR
jgi:hypothetical protein